ncbi:helix-turn-helix domain-containing protein [Limobrevibacterium gyesilva]|uniref:Helix-turn-helix domain-containing protein n=1 Tax=Limobrevibacterium gyesilva TaxID=2991712 RepID=A0AA42CIU4_9PROT|nr:helix-turn-helix domain-containing protein [Limobrevibacterium gyesilva]MCW3476282.1 helix-turn-helix domain-containing protein [Limobrevibacterium gyesilva]
MTFHEIIPGRRGRPAAAAAMPAKPSHPATPPSGATVFTGDAIAAARAGDGQATGPAPLPQLLSLAEVGALFNRRPRTIRGWIKAGRLPVVAVGGAHFVRRDQLEAMLEPSCDGPWDNDDK